MLWIATDEGPIWATLEGMLDRESGHLTVAKVEGKVDDETRAWVRGEFDGSSLTVGVDGALVLRGDFEELTWKPHP
jgi:hypothetical protein